MSFIIGVATTLGGILADKGVDKLLKENEGKIILWRAINKTSKKFKGYAPGGKRAVKQYLKIWTQSEEFADFVGNLEAGDSIDEAVKKALNSFESKSIPSLNKNAESVLAFLFKQINDGLMRSSWGLTLGVNRILMKVDQLIEELKKSNKEIIARLDKQSDTLDDLKRTSESFDENQKSAFEEFLSATQEWSSIKRFLDIGSFHDAQKGIEQRIDKLNEINQSYPNATKIFREHHVELLLKLASVLSNLGEFQKSESVYSGAKKWELKLHI